MKITSAQLHQQPIAVETTEQWSLSDNIKHIVIYPAVLILISLAVNYFFISNILPKAGASNMIYAGIFFLVGILHLIVCPRWLAHLWTTGLKHSTIYTAGLALIVSISSVVLFPIDINLLWVIASTAGSAFLLPFAFYACIYYLRGISARRYQPWVIPADAVPDTRKSLMLNSIGFKIKIAVKENDIAATIFTIHIQAAVKLSTVFIRFLHDHHDSIEAADRDGQVYGWLFTIPAFWGRTVLDPELTLQENKVKQDTIIAAERIAQ